jgi:hypothetical protein
MPVTFFSDLVWCWNVKSLLRLTNSLDNMCLIPYQPSFPGRPLMYNTLSDYYETFVILIL